MKRAIPPLQLADLPERQKAFWQLTGPGAVLVGLSIGAGEIVIWPRLTAQYGASLVWAAVLGVFLQLWVNVEIGRWAIATGESVYSGFARLWWGFAPAFLLFNLAGYLLPGWARTSGLALKALLWGPDHASPDWVWTAITFAAVAGILFGPRRIYRAVERTIGVMIVVIVIGLVVVAARVATGNTILELARGAVNFGHLERDLPIQEFFGAMVFAGAGGCANLFYAFYVRDKGIGMGGRMRELLNPFREPGAEVAGQTGYSFPETEENVRRFRDWFGFVVRDQTLYFWLLNTFTILLFVLAALAVLHPQGIVPQAGRLMWDEAAVLAGTMGPAGRVLFLVVAFATLFSTQVAIVDGLGRSLSDIVSTSFAFGRRRATAQWYAVVTGFVIVFGIGITMIMEYRGMTDLGFIFNSAYMGGFAMAVYTPAVLWMNLRHLPRSARPGPVNVAMVSLAAVVYVGFAVFSLAAELGWGS
ncbi:MAG TPA: Nramp family divalent metal transporter [Gemmatimonadales bacterium]|nr:Nramp family divalent metal transporter [Gemmatimonadales bacterium]